MQRIEWIVGSASYRRGTQDRVRVIERDDALVVLVADGAGGMPGGTQAAELAIEATVGNLPRDVSALSATDLCALLVRVDTEVLRDRVAGETTLVAAVARVGAVVGASAGDSCALLLHPNGTDELTDQQQRKRRIGGGRAEPIGFTRVLEHQSRLLVGTDGLFAHASLEALSLAVRAAPLASARAALLGCVTRANASLPDDVAFALVELPMGSTAAAL